jgi:hypothetical protein
VFALLKYLEAQRISLDKLKFSPDINLYLNDYHWIGRLVRDKMLKKQYAMATYGRSLLILYPKLKPYIEKEQTWRQYRSLWQDVSGLYKKFKRLDKDKLMEDDLDRLLQIETRWLRPSTILTKGMILQRNWVL